MIPGIMPAFSFIGKTDIVRVIVYPVNIIEAPAFDNTRTFTHHTKIKPADNRWVYRLDIFGNRPGSNRQHTPCFIQWQRACGQAVIKAKQCPQKILKIRHKQRKQQRVITTHREPLRKDASHQCSIFYYFLAFRPIPCAAKSRHAEYDKL
jgi:hypothetical protein